MGERIMTAVVVTLFVLQAGLLPVLGRRAAQQEEAEERADQRQSRIARQAQVIESQAKRLTITDARAEVLARFIENKGWTVPVAVPVPADVPSPGRTSPELVAPSPVHSTPAPGAAPSPTPVGPAPEAPAPSPSPTCVDLTPIIPDPVCIP
jgi:hypothetical protein